MSLERIWNIFKHCSMNLIDRSYVYLDDQRMELSKLEICHWGLWTD